MDKQQKKQVKKLISWVLIVAVVAVLAGLPMMAAGEEPESGPQASILTAQVERRDISAAVLGGGALTAQDSVAVTIPSDVKVTEYLVRNEDMVTAGQPVARVDRVSVMTAITRVQETMDELREQLSDISSETAPKEVTAAASGTVKVICGKKGEQVQDVILRDGALAVVSLDGLMAVRVARNTDLSGGDTVCVIFPDGTEVEGQVESNLEGILTVTVEDDGYPVGEEVRITTQDGNRLGTGQLYIHRPWDAVAYSGRISRIRVSEGDTVKAGRILFDLEDTGHSAEFEVLSRQHREYEALMLELFKLYQSETVTAPAGGMITGVDETGAYMLSSSGSWTVSLLANAPNGDDETTYVNYIGQVAEVGIDGLILKMNPQPLSITDYMDLSEVPTDPSLMTEDAVYTADAPVYELTDGQWVQIEAASIAAGDLLLFAGDPAGSFVWVVRVAQSAAQPELPDVTEPTKPSDSPEPTDPAAPTEPSSANPTRPSSSGHQSGNTSGFGGGSVQEDEAQLYSLNTVTIASVTAQEQMTVQITVDELDISQVCIGQTADMTVDALPGERFGGTVTGISNSGTNEGGNSKFTVEITVSKTENMLPGMTAYVSIMLTTQAHVPSIPVAALTETGTQTLVYTGYDAESEEFRNPVAVKTGISDGEYVQILSGLADGETVWYPYYDTLVISDAPETGGFRFG